LNTTVLAWLLRHNIAPFHTSLSTSEFLTRNNMTVVPHPTYFSVSPIEELKGRHFDTTEVTEAESQSTTSRMHLKKWQKRWERCIRVVGDYFEGDGGQ
jgi:hypothetical protein